MGWRWWLFLILVGVAVWRFYLILVDLFNTLPHSGPL